MVTRSYAHAHGHEQEASTYDDSVLSTDLFRWPHNTQGDQAIDAVLRARLPCFPCSGTTSIFEVFRRTSVVGTKGALSSSTSSNVYIVNTTAGIFNRRVGRPDGDQGGTCQRQSYVQLEGVVIDLDSTPSPPPAKKKRNRSESDDGMKEPGENPEE